ncbi:MAG: DUF4381 domain-containing protein [Gammaproteobacteria bacterium]|nr:DUF4381 domain-containing protein [Gammaproteobacteria bacterium]
MTNDPQQLPLRDIHLPEPVSWWPPAPGWWLLLLFILAILIAGLWIHRRRLKKRRSLKRLSRTQFQSLREAYEQHRNPQRLVEDLSILLRRVCIAHYPRATTASVTGKAWLELLDQTLEDQRFSKGPGKVLTQAPYRPHAQIDAQALLILCEDWLASLPDRTLGQRS